MALILLEAVFNLLTFQGQIPPMSLYEYLQKDSSIFQSFFGTVSEQSFYNFSCFSLFLPVSCLIFIQGSLKTQCQGIELGMTNSNCLLAKTEKWHCCTTVIAPIKEKKKTMSTVWIVFIFLTKSRQGIFEKMFSVK